MGKYLLCTLLALSLTSGCKEASDLERDANQAQNRADEKIQDAKVDASQTIRSAQADADEKIAAAQANFTTLREDYHHETVIKLAALDKKISELEAKALKSNGATRTTIESNLKKIEASRAVFMKDYNNLETATGASWDATKAQLDREWADLSKQVDEG